MNKCIAAVAMLFASSCFAFEFEDGKLSARADYDPGFSAGLIESQQLTTSERLTLLERLTHFAPDCGTGWTPEDESNALSVHREMINNEEAELQLQFGEKLAPMLFELILTEQTLSRDSMRDVIEMLEAIGTTESDQLLDSIDNHAEILAARFAISFLQDDLTNFIADNAVLVDVDYYQLGELPSNGFSATALESSNVVSHGLRLTNEQISKVFRAELNPSEIQALSDALAEAGYSSHRSRFDIRVEEVSSQIRRYILEARATTS
ncbi:MAG: hypothetical protein KA343_12000 [Nitrosomonas sp.]|nr:hypothetical protein [Nitrosomonas sp.]